MHCSILMSVHGCAERRSAVITESYAPCFGQEMVEVHQRSSEVRAQRPVQNLKPSMVEAQPNSNAPLLRDDRARQEWIEHELNMCCQVYLLLNLHY